MELILPSWFRGRQATAEPAGPETYRLTAPNLKESFISIRPVDGRWAAALRTTAEGPDVAVTTDTFARPEDAWDAAFELYRTHVVV